MKLYEISEQIIELLNIETDGDKSLEEAIQNSIEDMEGDLYSKLDNIVRVIHQNIADTVMIKNEVDRLNARKKSFDMENKGLSNYILNEMGKLKKKTIKTTLFTLTSATGRMAVKIDDAEKIPSEYINIKMEEVPDKKELLKAIKELPEGEEIAGVHAEKNPNTLRIK